MINQKALSNNLEHFTDRLLLEWIYAMLIQILSKVGEIDNDEKLIGMNILANVLGDKLILT